MTAELISDLGAAERLAGEWAALAEELGLPYCTPEWMLGWWRHAAPAGATLAIAVARDGGRVAGLVPAYVVREHGVRSLRMLGSAISHRAQPLAPAGRERELAPGLAAALAPARPAEIELAGLPAGSPWPAALAEAWPGRIPPGQRAGERMPAPVLRVLGSYDDWFAARSSNFRSQMRRARRDLEKQGASLGIAAGDEEAARAIDAFIALHHARWEDRGGSGALNPAVDRMLREEGPALVRAGRLRLATVATESQVVAVQAIVAAGGEASYWLGGFDEAWARSKPAIVALLLAVEDSFARGDDRFDFGGGDQDYKRRFTDEEETLAWSTLLPRSARTPVDRLLAAPWRSRELVARATRGPRHELRRRRAERATRRT